MAAELFKFVGKISGEQYASAMLDGDSKMDDMDTAIALNRIYDVTKTVVKWADTEALLVELIPLEHPPTS